MYNTSYKCVKPLTLWYDGPDGKKKPYRVKRGTIWHLVWCGGQYNFKGNMSNYPVTSLKSMLKGLCTTIEQYEKPQNPKALKDAVHINKHAMHIVRLYYTAFDILEQGKIITRRDKEHEELLAIRNGKYMREDGTYEPAFFDMVDSFEARFQKAVKESVLPAKPDMQKIEELLVAINKSYLSRTM